MGFDPGKEEERAQEMIDPGYYVQESVVDVSICAEIATFLERAAPHEKRAGLRNLMRFDHIRDLATQSCLVSLLIELCGKPMTPFKATLFSKTGKANWLVAWHQDTALPLECFEKRQGWGATSEKDGIFFAQAPASALARIVALRIHLDPSTSRNGPLRVIPESHKLGILSTEQIDRIAHENQAIECLVGEGGIVAMSPLLLHASSKSVSDEPRRILHIEYAESRDLEPGTRLAIA